TVLEATPEASCLRRLVFRLARLLGLANTSSPARSARCCSTATAISTVSFSATVNACTRSEHERSGSANWFCGLAKSRCEYLSTLMRVNTESLDSSFGADGEVHLASVRPGSNWRSHTG